ncbi:uncharacterized protein LOC106153305 [Lingula anatina]|uniref:Serine protease n=1 Tax=Lingula anatina TaxID=7574 RepID=A0A1S3H9F3_LINAN|nr:uncharacterized protein LOC106153305 [Lingula anatina]XP_013382638.1 uncharacterized protein LOC106153305 [Lingula anatina]|eukprot:XP_013382637.1 uncharacterized protein LOC106153305 [Lingula anatina]
MSYYDRTPRGGVRRFAPPASGGSPFPWAHDHSPERAPVVRDLNDGAIPVPELTGPLHIRSSNGLSTERIPTHVPPRDMPHAHLTRKSTYVQEDAKLEGATFYGVDDNEYKKLNNSAMMFQGFLPESIVQGDERIHITPCTSQPYRWVCYLVMTASDGKKFAGTGAFTSMISGKGGLILTAGHNLYMHTHGGYVKYLDIYPGLDGRSAPLGAYRVYPTHFRVSQNYVNNKIASEDYGAILLPASYVDYNQDEFGFGYSIIDDVNLLNQVTSLAGYPNDKPIGSLHLGGGRVQAVSDRRIFYDTDTAKGQSGSPVWMWNRHHFVLVGIHLKGVPEEGGYNSARRITKDLVAQVQQWTREIKQ